MTVPIRSMEEWKSRKCGHCIFADSYQMHDRDMVRKRCRRFPPTAMARKPAEGHISEYPDVTFANACAEFEELA